MSASTDGKKRVLIVVRSLRIGGMERVAVTLADAFADEGHDVHLLSVKAAKNGLAPENAHVHLHRVDFDKQARLTGIGLVYDLFARGVLNLFIRKSSAFWRGVYTSLLFQRYVRKLERQYGRFDQIIVRGQGTFEYLWMVDDPRMFLFLENVVPTHQPAFTLRAFYRNKNLVCVSQGVADSFREVAGRLEFKPRSLVVVPNPIPLSRVATLAQEECADIPHEPYIVNVARLVGQKNHPLLIEAYARSGLDLKLVIVGGGDDEPQLRRLVAQKGLADRVIFAGMQRNPFPWMRRARLFVLTSHFEGFGVVLVESLACGTPVVSVDSPGGIRDVLTGELANYIARPDADDLVDKIRFALEHPPLNPAALVARFDAPNVARQVLALSAM